MRTPLVAVAILGLGAVAFAGAGQQAPAARREQPVRMEPVAVPTGNGTPVITEGTFWPGEWADALRLAIADGVSMFLKEYRGVVFVGIRGVGPSDLFLAVTGGPVENLHVSFALCQRPVLTAGPDAPMRLGFVTDWYANKFRGDHEERELFMRLQREGLDVMNRMPRTTTYPSDGIEFAIRRSKFPGRVWLMRLSASAVVDNRPGMLTYPPSAPERRTDGWLEPRLK
jgi:hypothetical protein